MQMRRALSAVVIVFALAGCSSSNGKAEPGAKSTSTTSASVARTRNVAALAAYDGRLSTFATMLNASGLRTAVGARGPYTVFAPTNEAFTKLPHARLTALLSRAGMAELTKLVGDHVVRGRLLSKDLKSGPLKTLSGGTLTLTRIGGVVTVAGPNGKVAKIVSPALLATNGVVYRTDGVLARA
jgi:uncharacterized surface protein with fasciclin (FAS1) repeats